MEVKSTDYMTTDILDRAYEVQAEAAELMLELLDRKVALSKPDTSAGIYTMPYPSLINVIERNLDSLSYGGMVPEKMEQTVDWQGEVGDVRHFSYKDVNRWFTSVELLTAVTYSVKNFTPVTGTFCSGGNRVRQLLRTV